MKSIGTVLFDCDGVIIPNTPQMFVDLAHRVINRHAFLAKETILQYFQSAVSFSPWDAIRFFLGEMGLMCVVEEVQAEYQSVIVNDRKSSP